VGRVCAGVNPWSLVYWPTVLVSAYAVIAAFYLHRSRRRGVGTRIRPYVVVGVAIAVLLAVVSLWLTHHPLLPSGPQVFGLPLTLNFSRLVTPAVAIGLALLVLAWVERNLALLGFSLVYLVIALVSFTSGPVTHPSPWSFLPHLLATAAVLLLGSFGFAAIRSVAKRQAR
jgi:hypothetical protein